MDAALRGEETLCETPDCADGNEKSGSKRRAPKETFTCRVVNLRDNNDAREILLGGSVTGVFMSPRKSDSLTAGLLALYTEEL